MAGNTQHKLDRVRPPRVQITYDVEIGNAIEMKELPFVVGVIADLSGDRDPDNPLPKVKQRKFVEVDRDNFNDVLAKQKPRLAFQVDNVLSAGKDDQETMLNVLLEFKNIEDFSPVNVINQVPAMQKLYETRKRLSDLLTKLDGNDDLDHLLTNVLDNSDTQKKIASELQSTSPASGSSDSQGKQGQDKDDKDPKPSSPKK